MTKRKPKQYNREDEFKTRYGTSEDWEEFADIPVKYSGVMFSRIQVMGRVCSRCFPHGYEVPNYRMWHRNWKKYRETQYR